MIATLNKIANQITVDYIGRFIVPQRLWFVFSFLIAACNETKKESVAVRCYAPGNSGLREVDTTLAQIKMRQDTSGVGMVWIPGGDFLMGSTTDEGYPEEHPQNAVEVTGFWMDATEVTNRQFDEFVSATGYVTTAERVPDWEILKKQLPAGTPPPPDSLLVAGSLVFTQPATEVPLNDPSQWWRFVPGANWRHPTGPRSSIEDKWDHPVVQVSWEDAMAFCKWAGKRLPTEAEWEWAAKGSNKAAKYAWGHEDNKSDLLPANTWQGAFPVTNTGRDGYTATAPVKSFAANGFGLYEMSGNVWEWAGDWMDATYYATFAKEVKNPIGPVDGGSTSHPFQKVLKGGSFLCHPSYCTGYRVARRSSSGWDSGSNHAGFRCVRDKR